LHGNNLLRDARKQEVIVGLRAFRATHPEIVYRVQQSVSHATHDTLSMRDVLRPARDAPAVNISELERIWFIY
jgi:hypothetical protein